MRELVTVAIPLLNATLSPTEEDILANSMSMLRQYPIIWLCAEGTTPPAPDCMQNTTTSVFHFPVKYFESKAAFSKLLLMPDFYERFSWAENMLLHPLDTWMIKNELHYWCKQGYDLLMTAPNWNQSTIKDNLAGQFARFTGPSLSQKQALGNAFNDSGFFLCHIEKISAAIQATKKEAYAYRHDNSIANADLVFFELVPNRILPRLRKPTRIVQKFFAQQLTVAEMLISGKSKNIPFVITGVKQPSDIERVKQITSISL
ncbi:DUF5672 family protein [Dyadobacter tibetensis]|uniref:DUF5672 family protein n=1 Tax=Dyadobacter tibetensis TaxID=1211851 RepID=UPI0004707718|nr:DUF5672 family protein [Dyadobacter tibetensis]